MISFKPLLRICEKRKITSYTIKKDNVVGQASWKKIREGGHVDTRTIDALCEYLHCQPGDLMEYTEGVTESMTPDKETIQDIAINHGGK